MVRSSYNPTIRATHQTMLKKYNGSYLVLVLKLVRIGNAKDTNYIAILCYNVMLLRRISMRSNSISLKMTDFKIPRKDTLILRAHRCGTILEAYVGFRIIKDFIEIDIGSACIQSSWLYSHRKGY